MCIIVYRVNLFNMGTFTVTYGGTPLSQHVLWLLPTYVHCLDQTRFCPKRERPKTNKPKFFSIHFKITQPQFGPLTLCVITHCVKLDQCDVTRYKLKVEASFN